MLTLRRSIAIFALTTVPIGGVAGQGARLGSDAVDSTSTERLVKLSSLGVMPGVRVVHVQRHPATVLRIAETTIAIDGEVADEILVAPDDSPTGP